MSAAVGAQLRWIRTLLREADDDARAASREFATAGDPAAAAELADYLTPGGSPRTPDLAFGSAARGVPAYRPSATKVRPLCGGRPVDDGAAHALFGCSVASQQQRFIAGSWTSNAASRP